MSRKYPAITFTDDVKRTQAEFGVRAAATVAGEVEDDPLGAAEMAFIAQRDSFYLSTVNHDGWPYLQFRGGPVGFLKPLDEHRLAYADFRGNRQYLSMGNLRGNDRAALFLMDYVQRRRLKILARTRVHRASEQPQLAAAVQDPDYPATVERIVVFRVVAYDWNCPQHITPRYPAGDPASEKMD